MPSDQWKVDLYAHMAHNNPAVEYGGPSIWARLDVAYCNFFNPGELEGTPVDGRDMAAACEWTLPGCVDAAQHQYTFHGCGRAPKCYRERVWQDVQHASQHIAIPPVKLAQLIYLGYFLPVDHCPVPPGDTTSSLTIKGIFVLPRSSGAYCGLGGPYDGSNCSEGATNVEVCGPGGNSVSRGPTILTFAAYTGGHEIAHNFDADHLFGEAIDPSDPGGTVTHTLMHGPFDYETECMRREFSDENSARMNACELESWCPRAGFGP